jgi:hypothetical protein
VRRRKLLTDQRFRSHKTGRTMQDATVLWETSTCTARARQRRTFGLRQKTFRLGRTQRWRSLLAAVAFRGAASVLAPLEVSCAALLVHPVRQWERDAPVASGGPSLPEQVPISPQDQPMSSRQEKSGKHEKQRKTRRNSMSFGHFSRFLPLFRVFVILFFVQVAVRKKQEPVNRLPPGILNPSWAHSSRCFL